MKNNIKSFKALIERYRSIRIEEIEYAFEIKADVTHYLTKFGNHNSCSLCIEAKEISGTKELNSFCQSCVYKQRTGDKCTMGDNEFTYDSIWEASLTFPTDLLQAYRNRADYMESLINDIQD